MMTEPSHKVKIRTGKVEIEIEGNQSFVKEQLRNYDSLLGITPETVRSTPARLKKKAPAARKPTPPRKQKTTTSPAKKTTKPAVKKSVKPAARKTATPAPRKKYEKSLTDKQLEEMKQVLQKQAPKTDMETILAVAKYQTQAKNKKTFSAGEVTKNAKAVGRKFSNIHATLNTAAKKKLVKKVGKGIWKIMPQSQT